MIALSNSCYVSIDWKIPFSFTKKYPQNIKTKLKNKVTIKLSVPNKESFSISFFNGVFCCCLVLFFNRSDRSSVVTASSISYQYWDTNFLFLLRSAHHIYISEYFRTDHLIKRTGLHVFRTNPLVSNNCLDTAFWLVFFFWYRCCFSCRYLELQISLSVSDLADSPVILSNLSPGRISYILSEMLKNHMTSSKQEVPEEISVFASYTSNRSSRIVSSHQWWQNTKTDKIYNWKWKH